MGVGGGGFHFDAAGGKDIDMGSDGGYGNSDDEGGPKRHGM
jgi:hypothetical protein